MKKFGCVLGILGIILFLISFGLFGRQIFLATQAHEAHTLSLPLGEKINTEKFTVDTTKFCMVAVKATVRSEYSQRKAGENEKNEYELKFAFPFQYTVFDSSGKTLLTEKKAFAWDEGSRSYSNQRVTEHGGSEAIKVDYQKFKVAAPGEIRVEAQLDPDIDFQAHTSDAQLIFYDNVSEHSKGVISGIILLVVAGAFSFLGFVLFIIGMFRTAR